MINPLADASSFPLAFDQHGQALVEPFKVDQWVASSLLQKAIRRGDVKVAQRAALTFLGQRGTAIWRRFIIIAVEDVGAASVDAVARPSP
jgi:replication-associated recombination protein RarA